MRVTQNQMTRQYLNSSNTSLDNMNKINSKILSQRGFNKASEDSVGAAHAMILRKSLSNIDYYDSNIKSSTGILDSAEKALLNVSKITVDVTDSLVSAVNGDKGADEREILANQLVNLGDQMKAMANSKFGDRFLFGGTNNDKPPYDYDDGAKVLSYNGSDVSASGDPKTFGESKPILVDIGLGIKFNNDGTVDPQTALDISLNGAEYLGCGTDDDGDSKNIIDLTYKAADAIRSNDLGKAASLLDKINTAKSSLLIGITNIGNKEQTLTFATNRIEDDKINLKTQQQAVEGIDMTEEITNFKTAEMAYNATLSMGSKVIPNSIFDFIR